MYNLWTEENKSLDNNLWVEIWAEKLLYVHCISFYLELEDELDFSDGEGEIPFGNDLGVVVEVPIGKMDASPTAMAHQGFC